MRKRRGYNCNENIIVQLFIKIFFIFLFILAVMIIGFYYLYVQEDWYKASSTIDESKRNRSFLALYKMEPSTINYNGLFFYFDTVWMENPKHVTLFASGRSSRVHARNIFTLNISLADSCHSRLPFDFQPLLFSRQGPSILSDRSMLVIPFDKMLKDTFACKCSDKTNNSIIDTVYFYKISN